MSPEQESALLMLVADMRLQISVQQGRLVELIAVCETLQEENRRLNEKLAEQTGTTPEDWDF